MNTVSLCPSGGLQRSKTDDIENNNTMGDSVCESPKEEEGHGNE